MKTARGIAAAISTVPSATPEPVSCSASQASAMKWNWSPMSEMVSPVNTRRKSGSLSGSSIAGPPCGSSGVATGVLVVGVAVVSNPHSTEMTTPSPVSSSASTMVPVVLVSTACSMSAA